MCSEFFVSKYHLIRKFKEYINPTVYHYILSKRIVLARHLIRQGVAVTSVAEECGFSDYSNFYKAFTAKLGMPPAQFKKYCNHDF
ncbi:MAG: helix-turn-helix domain-containing protein [Clostridium sp.]